MMLDVEQSVRQEGLVRNSIRPHRSLQSLSLTHCSLTSVPPVVCAVVLRNPSAYSHGLLARMQGRMQLQQICLHLLLL